MTKQIDCQLISLAELNKNFELLDENPRHRIDQLLWSNDGYFPEAAFTLAYTKDSLLLKFYVKEKYLIARHNQINDLVYKDSCVEFFVSFDKGLNYYNLEFNCIGTPYVAYGPDKNNRSTLPVEHVKNIQIQPHAPGNSQDDFKEWCIMIQIPFNVFIYNNISSLKGSSCKANFYKCGDETPAPHYLSWNNISSHTPDFHLPEFFGTVFFV